MDSPTQRPEESEMGKIVMANLECPICLDFTKPPINQCFNGHLICNVCVTRIALCPVCREDMPFKPIRNLIFEQILLSLYFICPNAGCTVKFTNKETMDRHNLVCSFRGGVPTMRATRSATRPTPVPIPTISVSVSVPDPRARPGSQAGFFPVPRRTQYPQPYTSQGHYFPAQPMGFGPTTHASTYGALPSRLVRASGPVSNQQPVFVPHVRVTPEPPPPAHVPVSLQDILSRRNIRMGALRDASIAGIQAANMVMNTRNAARAAVAAAGGTSVTTSAASAPRFSSQPYLGTIQVEFLPAAGTPYNNPVVRLAPQPVMLRRHVPPEQRGSRACTRRAPRRGGNPT